jgi:hypothetical protein
MNASLTGNYLNGRPSSSNLLYDKLFSNFNQLNSTNPASNNYAATADSAINSGDTLFFNSRLNLGSSFDTDYPANYFENPTQNVFTSGTSNDNMFSNSSRTNLPSGSSTQSFANNLKSNPVMDRINKAISEMNPTESIASSENLDHMLEVPTMPISRTIPSDLTDAPSKLSPPTEGDASVWAERFTQEAGANAKDLAPDLAELLPEAAVAEGAVDSVAGPAGLAMMAGQAVGTAATDITSSVLTQHAQDTFQANANKPGISSELQSNLVASAQTSNISSTKALMGGLSFALGPVGALIGYAFSPSMNVSNNVNLNTAYSSTSTMFNPQNQTTVATGMYSDDQDTNILTS